MSLGNVFLSLVVDSGINCEFYEREYISLLDTFSNIGGIFSNLQTFFLILLMYYSNDKNNYQITKEVIYKKNSYQNKIKNTILLKDNDKNQNIQQTNEDNIKKEKEKEKEKEKDKEKTKIKLNMLELFCCGFLKCNKKRKTMSIINACNNFVEEYLTAERIIFNNILFEQYYNTNPINIDNIHILKDLENKLFYKRDKHENRLLEDYENEMGPINS